MDTGGRLMQKVQDTGAGLTSQGSKQQSQGRNGCNVVALGMFDGVHIGHQRLLETASRLADVHGYRSLALTFNRHPLEILNPACAPPLICDIDQKCNLIEACGVGEVRVVDFNRRFARMDPAAFVREYLRLRLRARIVVVGFNYTFGRDAKGDTAFLKQQGRQAGLQVYVVPPVTHRGQVVSSSLIRGKISNGQVSDASQLLGRYFSFNGVVVAGEGRGRTLGYPTANIRVKEHRVIPGEGVYLVGIDLSEYSRGYGLLSISTKPTFSVKDNVIEAHIFDFSGDLYGKRLRVHVFEKLRDIVTFSSKEALVRQISCDVFQAKQILGRCDGDGSRLHRFGIMLE